MLDVASGGCVVVRGASGSGKTRLLRAIADLDPNEGQVLCGGLDRRAMPASRWRRKVAFVPAESGWWDDIVRDHFPAAADPVAELEALGLPREALDWRVERLSTGERQRLALARALAGKPDVLLLDEPTSGLDAEARTAVESRLRRFRDGGGAIVLVTHDADQAQRLGASHLTVAGGRLEDAA
ncbi:ATP-binding cassette domain-containing protein [Breoghania sp. L-A4]|uniref:ABC transporter ATP-binding protein n=1 Tax=Breoghania sp. L-A4 TaxID=2304600 RepID=UPI0020BE397D|nr:ATP-binding cassette domain-containing protein [Breoghania sp. L-A4]